MIVKDCPFDPVRDIAPVEQFGFIDLKDALANSVVPSQMPESETDYNGIEEPDMVLGKPSDVFEAIDMQRAVQVAVTQNSEDSNE